MGGPGCKVILCVCSAAQSVERGNVLLAYRVGEGESINEHQSLIHQMGQELQSICSIIKDATGINLRWAATDRRSLPVLMREAYETFLQNEDKFTEAQTLSIINHANSAESLGDQWNTALLKDAGWPPIP